jgi:hypothetical protein
MSASAKAMLAIGSLDYACGKKHNVVVKKADAKL